MLAALTLSGIPERKAPFCKINLDLDEFGFDELPKCGQRLTIWLYEATKFATETIRFTDAQIAAALDRSRSWVQKALAAICDRSVETADGEKHDAPIARRFRAYGTRDKAGRVIEFVADWAKNHKPKVKPGGLAGAAKAKGTSRARGRPGPRRDTGRADRRDDPRGPRAGARADQGLDGQDRSRCQGGGQGQGRRSQGQGGGQGGGQEAGQAGRRAASSSGGPVPMASLLRRMDR